MNKQLILNNIEAFNHWLNGGKVLCSQYHEPSKLDWEDMCWSFNDSDMPVIINDEYVEFRKALAEGKTVQCKDHIDEGDGWYEPEQINAGHFDKTCTYRIKPEEPQFTAGDWVRIGDKITKVSKIKGDAVYMEDGKWQNKNCFELWQPQPDEWCWFYNEGQKSSRLAQFNHIAYGEDREGQYKDMQGNYFTSCEPFIGEVPEYLKKLKDR
jgi:hypothetical protein